MATPKIFVSHSHHDADFCHALVEVLRAADADVWYDEHDLDRGQLMEVVQRELHHRPIFIVILSKEAFASRWVKRETQWAYELADRDPSRIILPVTAKPIERGDFSGDTGWLFLIDFKRIEADYQPLLQAEAIHRVLHALALSPKMWCMIQLLFHSPRMLMKLSHSVRRFSHKTITVMRSCSFIVPRSLHPNHSVHGLTSASVI